MKPYIRYCAALMTICVLLHVEAQAQQIKAQMRAVFEAFRQLQPYLFNAEAFERQENSQKVLSLIKSLSDNFHGVEAFPPKYSDEPGFASSLSLMSDMLDDSARRFKEGKRSYAYWRMRSVANNCVSCHVTYRASLAIYDTGMADIDLPLLQRGEFYAATRQYQEAERAFEGVARDSTLANFHMQAMSRLMTLFVRVDGKPEAAAKKLRELYKIASLTLDEQETVERWIEAFDAWAAEKSKAEISLESARKLITKSVGGAQALSSRGATVPLLRATGQLHWLLSSRKLTGDNRAEALYLLGFAYNRLSSLFIEELPEFYLQQCIEEFPGTERAQKSYKLLKEIVTLGYTGSGGTHVPGDVSALLMELHDKAYGVKQLDGQI